LKSGAESTIDSSAISLDCPELANLGFVMLADDLGGREGSSASASALSKKIFSMVKFQGEDAVTLGVHNRELDLLAPPKTKSGKKAGNKKLYRKLPQVEQTVESVPDEANFGKIFQEDESLETSIHDKVIADESIVLSAPLQAAEPTKEIPHKTIESRFEDMTSYIDSVVESNQVLTTTVQSLEATVQVLTTSNQALTTSNQALTTSNQALTTSNQALITSNQELKSKCGDLELRVGSLSTKLAEVDSDLADVKSLLELRDASLNLFVNDAVAQRAAMLSLAARVRELEG